MPERLIDQIYEAAFVPELWSDALDAVARAHGCASGAIGAWNELGAPLGFRATPLVRAAVERSMSGHDGQSSPRFLALHAAREASFMSIESLLSRDTLEADVVQHGLRQLGLDSQAATAIPMPSGDHVCISFERYKHDGTFDETLLSALNELRPHFARAGLIAARLGLARAEATVSAMRTMGLPAAVLSASGNVLTTNSLFEAMAATFLPSSHGALAISDADANQLLQKIFVVNPSRSELIVRSIPVAAQPGRGALVVHVIPLRRAAHEIFSGGDLLVVATSLRATEAVPSPSILMGLFDLTPAEVKLATALASGRSVQQAAIDAVITVSSARTYLDRIFRKTGTHQQSQLVALLKSAQSFTVSQP